MQNAAIDSSLDSDTVLEMRAVVFSAGSYRWAAKRLGISHGVVYNIANERGQDVSWETENHVRDLLGLPALPPRPPVYTVPACEDCGDVHTGRCRNREVKIVPVKRRTYTRIADMPTSMLARMIRDRVEI